MKEYNYSFNLNFYFCKKKQLPKKQCEKGDFSLNLLRATQIPSNDLKLSTYNEEPFE